MKVMHGKVLGGLFLGLLVSIGCQAPLGSPPKIETPKAPDAVIRSAIESIEAATMAIDEISDDATAEKAVAVIQGSAQALNLTRQAATKFAPMNSNQEATMKAIGKEVSAALAKSKKSTEAALAKIDTGKFGKETATHLRVALGQFGSASTELAQALKPWLE
jgi:hypothetical protein